MQPPPPGLLQFLQSEKDCTSDIKTLEDVMNFTSLLFPIAATYALIRTNRKNLHFPHNVPILMLFASFLQALGHLLAFFFRENNSESLLSRFQSLCFIQAFVTVSGLVSAFYIWVSSFIVLYLATVLQVPILKLRSNRKYYYSSLMAILLVIHGLMVIIGNFAYTGGGGGQCILRIEPTSWYLGLFGMAWIAAAASIVLLPPIFRTLVKTDINLLSRSRVLMLRAEAVRQVVLALVMILASIIAGYRYGVAVYVSSVSGFDNAMVQRLAYSTCVADSVWSKQLGTYVGLLYLVEFVMSRRMVLCGGKVKSKEPTDTAVRKFRISAAGVIVRSEAPPVIFDEEAAQYVEVVTPSSSFEEKKPLSSSNEHEKMKKISRVIWTITEECELDGLQLSEAETIEMANNVLTMIQEGEEHANESVVVDREKMKQAKLNWYMNYTNSN